MNPADFTADRPDAIRAQPTAAAEPPRPDASTDRRWPWQVVCDFWTKPLPAAPLALFRILLGTTVLLSCLLSLLPRLGTDLGPDPLLPAEALGRWPHQTGRLSLLTGPDSVPLLGESLKDPLTDEPLHNPYTGKTIGPLLSDQTVRAWAELGQRPWFNDALFGVWLASLVLLTVGLATRPASVLAWLLAASFQTRLAWLNNGGDALFRCALFYLMLSPSGAAWSLDRLRYLRRCRRRGLPEPAAPTVPAWPVRLMQIQLCCVYFFTGLIKITSGYPETGTWWEKIQGQDWLNGEAVYWVLNDLSLNRFPYWALPVPLIVCRFLSWATLAFELGFPVIVTWRRVRPFLLLAGVAFHLGILVHTEVGWFSQVSMCWYALFLRGPTADAILRWFARRLGFGRTQQPTPGPEVVPERTAEPALAAR